MNEITPIESLRPPQHLDGRTGRNRGVGLRQIAAEDDRSAVLAWLARYSDSPATLSSYRKEVERLLLWCVLQHGVALSDLTHEDMLVYQRFLAQPEPAQRWVMASGQKPPRLSPAWRPFAGPLSPQSVRQALSIINGLFNWLVHAGYLAGNPLALARRKSTRWLFSLLYVGGLRVSEVCGSTMGDFFYRRSADGKGRWWLDVMGKGEKSRLVPATEELVVELMRYRRSLGLPPLPSGENDTPLLLPLIGAAKPMARTAVHEILKAVMKTTAARLKERGDPEAEIAAAHIEQASTHWIRHTAGSHQSNAMDLKAVRDNLGHSNIATTNTYVHSEDDARHDATSAVHRVGWISN